MKRLAVLTLALVAAIATTTHATVTTTTEILVTAEDGRALAPLENVDFVERDAKGPSIRVYPRRARHAVEGIGSSITESSAFVLAHLDPQRRREVMARIWGHEGANFSMTRTHIGSCDFTVEGKYSYAPEPGDDDLSSFSIAPDRAGFDPDRHAGVVDPDYDLLPMIREALAIKNAQGDALRIVASAWTAPPWMKNTGEWFIPSSEENDWQGTGGSLLPQHYGTYADYLVRYLDAYRAAGVPIWGITPVNEPHGNGGFWESMHFTPQEQNTFVNVHLGPVLQIRGFGDTKLFVYDQNRDGLEKWAQVILTDPRSREYVDGVAVHWYSSTVDVYEDTIARVRAEYLRYTLLHTEGCIDDLGQEAGPGIEDPDGFEEEGWFDNDTWWWNRNATDWAYTATWAGESAADHPMYVPVHRYARDVIVGLDHGLSGWIDWNVVLDRHGGPNHVGNFCGAPIMIDTETQKIHFTPIFHVLSQFSRTIRPGDRVLTTERTLGGLGSDDLHACATRADDGTVTVQLLNTTKDPLRVDLEVDLSVAAIDVPANAMQTVRFEME
ncbi:MAG TPA: glycoside hydrolase family 30 beta sandwich domain-containing protein [Candidatus Krumholzibacteria bacterium]|nr:glycoside hydrolase family 30 beta sandwich domain-containing protein [Candidatus Krumholzibacteria bacterium]